MKFLNLIIALAVTCQPFIAKGVDTCISCGLTGLPTTSLKTIEKLAINSAEIKNKNTMSRSPASEEDDQWSKYQLKCITFETSSKNQLPLFFKEIENSGISVDEYFSHSTCQSKFYSDSVKSPMIHYVADDPFNKQDFLQTIFQYYIKKRKDPEAFKKAINLKNTNGETLLDYIESSKQRKMYSNEAIEGPLVKIISMLCEHGGEYSYQKDKKCP